MYRLFHAAAIVEVEAMAASSEKKSAPCPGSSYSCSKLFSDTLLLPYTVPGDATAKNEIHLRVH